MADDTSARGTPHTVRPTIGAGSHRSQVSKAAELIADGKTAEPAAYVNGEFLAKLDPAALNANPLVRGLAVLTARRLLGQMTAALSSVMGLHPATVAGIMRELADELAPAG